MDKPTIVAAENSKESCAPATSENAPITGDVVSPGKGEAAPVSSPIAEGTRFSLTFFEAFVFLCVFRFVKIFWI